MTAPSAATRSCASMTREYSSSGSTMWRSKIRGRSWYAMRSASRKPRVVTSSVGSPLRSSSALVATVVPIFTHSTCSGVIGSRSLKPSRWRMPATAASRYCSGFSDSSLCVTSDPSGRLPTTSVKVPPRSIQNCQRSCECCLSCMGNSISRSTLPLGEIWHEDGVGLRADLAYPFEREAFAEALDLDRELARNAFDFHAVAAQLVDRARRRRFARRPAARFGRAAGGNQRVARRGRQGLHGCGIGKDDVLREPRVHFVVVAHMAPHAVLDAGDGRSDHVVDAALGQRL